MSAALRFSLGANAVTEQSDGQHDLLDIAERAGMRFAAIEEAAEALLGVGLLEEVTGR
jgi:aminopeptidase-like protein